MVKRERLPDSMFCTVCVTLRQGRYTFCPGIQEQRSELSIPEPIIRRRFEQGWSNFQSIYKVLVDSWQVYDAMKTPPVLTEEGGQA